MLQVASDSLNVNLLFLKYYWEKKVSINCLPFWTACPFGLLTFLDIGTCGINTIHGSLKNAEKAGEMDIGKVFKSMPKIIMDSLARRENFEKITECDVNLLPYCGHWWCEKYWNWVLLNEAALSKTTCQRRGKDLFGFKKGSRWSINLS